MLKKSFLIISLFFAMPVFADFDPMSDEPINSPEEFWQEVNNADNTKRIEEVSSGDSSVSADQDINAETESYKVEPTKNYAEIYHSLEPATHSYVHNIDPDQYYDIKDTAWSPYPLFRLNSPIYFKDRTIEPGYYLLTPREYKGDWFLLFKQNGNVAHIIPVYERDIVPELFYDKHLAKPKYTKAQKIHMGVLNWFGKFDSSKRKEPVKNYLEINDLENNFVSIVVYYGNHKYSTIFRTVKL